MRDGLGSWTIETILATLAAGLVAFMAYFVLVINANSTVMLPAGFFVLFGGSAVVAAVVSTFFFRRGLTVLHTGLSTA
jgi:hypothetical protein